MKLSLGGKQYYEVDFEAFKKHKIECKFVDYLTDKAWTKVMDHLCAIETKDEIIIKIHKIDQLGIGTVTE